MKRFSSTTFSIAFSVFLFCSISMFSGFVEGTLVKTPQGLVSIEDIQQGDFVIGCSDDGTLTKAKVVSVSEKEEDLFVVISLKNDKRIFVSEDQKLYDPVLKKWIKAKDITVNNVLVDSHFKNYSCLSVEVVNKPAFFCELSLESPHTFFVSDLEIRVHNFFPAVMLALSWTFGEAIVFEGAALTIGVLGVVAHKLFSDNRKIEIKVDKQAVAEKAGIHLMGSKKNKAKQKAKEERKRAMIEAKSGGSRPPNDDEDKKKKKERVVNTMSKTEFFHKDLVKSKYQHWQDKIYKLKKRANGLEKDVEFLKWDHLHGHVEAYNSSEVHIGVVDPQTLKIAREFAVKGRTLFG